MTLYLLVWDSRPIFTQLKILSLSEGQKNNYECIMSINNQLEMFMFKRDTCTLKLKDILDHKIMEECEKLKMSLKEGIREY